MDRQYTKVDEVVKIIDPIINDIKNESNRRDAYVHLYGVGNLASLIALKRGYSRDIAELACITGMLHDLYKFAVDYDADEHAHKGAMFVKENILSKLDDFSQEEKDLIYNGIFNHSDKNIKGYYFDEIIKDADLLHHTLRNPNEEYYYNHEKIKRVLNEMTD